VRHQRHYTLQEADALRGWVGERVREARAALDRLISPESRSAMAALDPQGGGGWPGRDVAAATLLFQRCVADLHGAEIVVRDLARGLVDFPAVREGTEVYLCWLVDEDEIGFWHDLDAGFAGRRPLEGAG
jgi:hypothetical protein